MSRKEYIISFSGGGWFFEHQMTDPKALIKNIRDLGFKIELEKGREQDGLYHLITYKVVKYDLTIEDLFDLNKKFPIEELKDNNRIILQRF